jgi:small subunit ribosomal protein S1
VLDIDGDRRRISLGMKQCKENPWDHFAQEHKKGDRVHGTIRSMTDFGIFVGLDQSIDGLVHLSDLSWSETGEAASRQFKKGDEVDAVILAIDVERERISLGIKQLESNPVEDFVQANENKVIDVEVVKVLAKSATIKCGDDLDGVLKIAEYSSERVSDLRERLEIGEKLQVKVMGSDAKYGILVSKRAVDSGDMAQEKTSKVQAAPKSTTLGDLLKEQMNQNKDS